MSDQTNPRVEAAAPPVDPAQWQAFLDYQRAAEAAAQGVAPPAPLTLEAPAFHAGQLVNTAHGAAIVLSTSNDPTSGAATYRVARFASATDDHSTAEDLGLSAL